MIISKCSLEFNIKYNGYYFYSPKLFIVKILEYILYYVYINKCSGTVIIIFWYLASYKNKYIKYGMYILVLPDPTWANNNYVY